MNTPGLKTLLIDESGLDNHAIASQTSNDPKWSL